MLAYVRGAGDIATGVALRLHRAGIGVVMADIAVPTSIRRTVCFSEAIRLGECEVEGVRAVRASGAAQALEVVAAGDVAVVEDPELPSWPSWRLTSLWTPSWPSATWAPVAAWRRW